nr:MAG TPA: hypothetical protein [Caudoviricetes sp.]
MMETVLLYTQFGKKVHARELYFQRKAIYQNHRLQRARAIAFRYGLRARKKKTYQYSKIIQRG